MAYVVSGIVLVALFGWLYFIARTITQHPRGDIRDDGPIWRPPVRTGAFPPAPWPVTDRVSTETGRVDLSSSNLKSVPRGTVEADDYVPDMDTPLTKSWAKYPGEFTYDDDGWIVSRGDNMLAFVQTETMADVLIEALESYGGSSSA